MGHHLCAAPGCAIEVTTHKLMCTYHWFKVPAHLRREVTGRYQTYRLHPGPLSRKQYFEARALAVDEVTP